MHEKDFDHAIKDLSVALKLVPHDLEALERRAFCHAKLHEYAASIADYSKLIAYAPLDGGPYLERGLAYEKSGKPAEAKADRAKAAELGCHPGDRDDVLRTKELYYRGRYQEAINRFNFLVNRGCRTAELFYLRGYCYMREDRYTEAAGDFTQYIKIRPYDLSVRLLRAQAFLNTDKFLQATEDCTAIINQTPKGAVLKFHTASGREEVSDLLFEAYNKRILAYKALGRFQEAMSDCSALILHWPGESRSHEMRASIALRLGKPQVAIADGKLAVKLDPHDSTAWMDLATAYGALHDFNNAVLTCDKYLRIYPQDDDGYLLRGDFLAKAGKTAEAIADYSRAIDMDPHNSAEARKKRASAYAKLGKQADAEKDLAEAQRLDLGQSPGSKHDRK